MNKIAIAGAGFVGKAYHRLINDLTLSTAYLVDPFKGFTDIEYDHSDAVIICVSTPPDAAGACNVQNVLDVIAECPNVPILIKSTISIEGWHIIRRTFPYADITFSPEFLRAEHAYEDLRDATTLMFGGDNVDYWHQILSVRHTGTTVSASPEELILAKYFRNSFLATKVSFFNQVYDLCETLGIDYDVVRKATALDERIGDSHTEVTKHRGYGGHCFPKDTDAIVHTAKATGVELSLIEESIEYNRRIRKSMI